MKKDYPITKLDSPKEIQALDNLISNVFSQAQDKEHLYFEVAEGFETAEDFIKEKQIVLCKYTPTVGAVSYRIYTKISGSLKYIQLT